MGWFCNTPEAKAQLKKCYTNACPGCHKCISIEESAGAMVDYGTPIESSTNRHPLYNKIKSKFNAIEID